MENTLPQALPRNVFRTPNPYDIPGHLGAGGAWVGMLLPGLACTLLSLIAADMTKNPSTADRTGFAAIFAAESVFFVAIVLAWRTGRSSAVFRTLLILVGILMPVVILVWVATVHLMLLPWFDHGVAKNAADLLHWSFFLPAAVSLPAIVAGVLLRSFPLIVGILAIAVLLALAAALFGEPVTPITAIGWTFVSSTLCVVEASSASLPRRVART